MSPLRRTRVKYLEPSEIAKQIVERWFDVHGTMSTSGTDELEADIAGAIKTERDRCVRLIDGTTKDIIMGKVRS